MAGTIDPRALMAVALGRQRPDLVVAGGRVVNSFTREVEALDIAIAGGRIAAIGAPGSFAETGAEVLDATGHVVVPGLIDAHFHVGGSHLDVFSLARSLLARGTTAIATDFYEIYVTAGPPAVRFALDEAERAGLSILFVPPAHLIGLEDVGTFAWPVSIADMREMLAWPEAVGINEPPAAAVLAQPPGLVELLADTIALNKLVVGHAPNETGAGLQAYVGLGASSDHESRSVPEALAKLRVGMRPMMRHGSASPDMARLIGLAHDLPASTRWMMFCSDETDPGDLARDGHMDEKIRLAVASGIDPLTAIEMSSVNVAEYYQVTARHGAVAPGRWADLLLVPDLAAFRPALVLAKGRVVARDGLPSGEGTSAPAPAGMTSQARVGGEIEPALFRLPAPECAGATVRARVFGVRDGTLVSDALVRELPVAEGIVLADPDRDILRMAVIERHHASGRVGRAFVEGFGLRDGAVAMSYCHVFHNLLVVGTSDERMALAADELRRLGGGVVVVGPDGIRGSWRLPLVGVLDQRPLPDVAASFAAIDGAMRSIGCPLASPILSFSFVALPTIPAYGLTDRGLYDVGAQAFVDVVLDEDR
jgi:adenine deaminase